MKKVFVLITALFVNSAFALDMAYYDTCRLTGGLIVKGAIAGKYRIDPSVFDEYKNTDFYEVLMAGYKVGVAGYPVEPVRMEVVRRCIELAEKVVK